MFNVPSLIVLQLLEQCNLRCTMCYEWGQHGSFHDKDKLATLDIDVALRIINECGVYHPKFEFFGGEPLLYPDVWRLIQCCRDNGCELAFSTNGTVLEKYARQLVEHAPTRLWVSLDGTSAINNQQRGRGVFERAMSGLKAVAEMKAIKQSRYPELGITYVVTPLNFHCVEAFFLEQLDLNAIDCVSIELQSYLTQAQSDAYRVLLAERFAVKQAVCAQPYVRDVGFFQGIDIVSLTQQLSAIASVCQQRGIVFHCQPNVISVENIEHYFSANWQQLSEYKTRCAVPWLTAEISARGEVSTCHSFYDVSLGNVYQDSLLTIWRGEKTKQWREYLRTALLPVCTACCRYYNAEVVFT